MRHEKTSQLKWIFSHTHKKLIFFLLFNKIYLHSNIRTLIVFFLYSSQSMIRNKLIRMPLANKTADGINKIVNFDLFSEFEWTNY